MEQTDVIETGAALVPIIEMGKMHGSIAEEFVSKVKNLLTHGNGQVKSYGISEDWNGNMKEHIDLELASGVKITCQITSPK